jgi:hypothetical protein
MDRCIEINMQRKTKGEKAERLRRRDNDQHGALRRKCLRWTNDNRTALAAIEVQAPLGLDDRAFDIWEPLLTIAQLVGGDWPKLATEAAIALSGGEDDSDETRVELLHDIENEFLAIFAPVLKAKRTAAKKARNPLAMGKRTAGREKSP